MSDSRQGSVCRCTATTYESCSHDFNTYCALFVWKRATVTLQKGHTNDVTVAL